jgi:hypothetical protein
MKNKNIIITAAALAFIIAVFALNSCKSKDDSGYEELTINVDNSRIGNEFVDMNLKFKFNPPKGWLLKPSELTEKIVSRQKSDKEGGNGFVYKPIYIFFSDSTKGILTLGTVEKNDSSKTPIQIQRYQDEIIARFGKDNIEIRNFIKDKIMFSQLTITKQSIITKKLIFKNIDGNYLQFDYTLQKDILDVEEKAIESSLGTLKLVK